MEILNSNFGRTGGGYLRTGVGAKPCRLPRAGRIVADRRGCEFVSETSIGEKSAVSCVARRRFFFDVEAFCNVYASLRSLVGYPLVIENLRMPANLNTLHLKRRPARRSRRDRQFVAGARHERAAQPSTVFALGAPPTVWRAGNAPTAVYL